MKRFGSLLVGLILLLTLPAVVLALDNPDSVSIGEAYVFEDVLETGDQLFFIRYDVEYSPSPNTSAEETWQAALYEDGGGLVASRPLNYYQHNIISLYLDAGDAITTGDPHEIRVMGMPSVFDNLTEGLNMRTHTCSAGEYKEGDTIGSYMITVAGTLQTDWGITLLSSNDKLNDTGAAFFTDAVPGLGTIDPTIFQTTQRTLTPSDPNWNISYPEELEARSGEGLREAINGTMLIFGVEDEFWGVAFIAVILLVLISAPIYASTRQPSLGIAAAMPVIFGLAWLGLGGDTFLQWLLIIFFIAAVIFALMFHLRHFG